MIIPKSCRWPRDQSGSEVVNGWSSNGTYEVPGDRRHRSLERVADAGSGGRKPTGAVPRKCSDLSIGQSHRAGAKSGYGWKVTHERMEELGPVIIMDGRKFVRGLTSGGREVKDRIRSDLEELRFWVR